MERWIAPKSCAHLDCCSWGARDLSACSRKCGDIGTSEDRKRLRNIEDALYVAWSSAETGASSRAIRAIRRSMSETSLANFTGVHRDDNIATWSLTPTFLEAWKQRPSWLPGAGMLGSLLERIQTSTVTRVSDLFHVHQGIRTGARNAFVQPATVVARLPRREQQYFKEAVDAESFVEGEIRPRKCLFVADRRWQSVSEVRDAVPEFFRRYLQPTQKSLEARKSKRARHWWELSEPRGWAFEGTPRLVSKRFGLYPAFARDLEGRFAVVQANAWKPTEALIDGGAQDTLRDDALREALTAYWWLLNSRIMVALLREYCPNVAGGQLDLEHKYVRHVPLPNLVRQSRENPAFQVLASSIRARNADRLPKISDRDQFAAAAFGTDVSDWNLSGLGLPD